MSMASWRAADALAPSVAVASVFRASRRSSAGVAGEPSFATAAGSLAAGEKGLARSWTRLGPITAGGAAAVPAPPAGEARARTARAPTAPAAPARRRRGANPGRRRQAGLVRAALQGHEEGDDGVLLGPGELADAHLPVAAVEVEHPGQVGEDPVVHVGGQGLHVPQGRCVEGPG